MNSIRHICHITCVHPKFDSRIFYRECVSLKESGFNVTLIAPCQSVSQEKGVNIVPLPKTSWILFRRLIITSLAAHLATKVKADLYHFHDPELIPAMRWLSRHTKRPVIWDAHENYVSTIGKFKFSKFPFLKNWITNWFNRMELSACKNDFAGVVTITDAMAYRYQNFNIPTCVLSNFIELSSIHFPPRITPSIKPRLINTGSLFLERGVIEMANAFQLLRKDMDCQIALWGNFQPPSLADQIRRRLTKTCSNVDVDVLIGGPYPWRTLVGELIPTGWAGCVLLDQNDQNACMAHANRLFEYWANGLPVIANAGTESARIVQEVGGGIVIKNNNPQEIATAFRILVKERDLARKMANSGRKAVEEKFNWRNNFPSLLEFYAKFGINVS